MWREMLPCKSFNLILTIDCTPKDNNTTYGAELPVRSRYYLSEAQSLLEKRVMILKHSRLIKKYIRSVRDFLLIFRPEFSSQILRKNNCARMHNARSRFKNAHDKQISVVMNESIIVSLDIFIINFASDTRTSVFREIFPANY